VLLPAKKIVGARLKLGARSVRAARCPLGIPPSKDCATRYALSASTRFVQLTDGQSVEAYVPPLPQIFPAFPADILYPFFRPAAGGAARALSEAEAGPSAWFLVAVPAFVFVVGAAMRRNQVS